MTENSQMMRVASDDFLFPARNSADNFAKNMTIFELSSLEDTLEEKKRELVIASEDMEQKR